MSLDLNTFCAPSAGSAAWISALLPWGVVMDVCPQSMTAGAGGFIKIKAGETSLCQKGKGSLGQETPFVFSGRIRFY